jgi:hypothetical protein
MLAAGSLLTAAAGILHIIIITAAAAVNADGLACGACLFIRI